MRSPPCKSFSRDTRAEVDQHGRAHRILFKTAFCLPPVADLQFEGGLADAHADPHAGGEALQMLAMQQVLRQLQLPLPAHADTPGNQALQVSSHFPSLPLSSTFDGRGAAMKTEIALSLSQPLSRVLFQMRDLWAQVHAVVPPAATQPRAHGRQEL